MSKPESFNQDHDRQSTAFDEMVMYGDLADVDLNEEIRMLRVLLKDYFAREVEIILEEIEGLEGY